MIAGIRRIIMTLTVAALASACAHAGPGNAAADVPRVPTLSLFLTWQGDPTTTMTIDWHTEDPASEARLDYRRQGEDEWESVVSEAISFPYSGEVALIERVIHRVELTDLEPDAIYEFRTQPLDIFSFRTMPRELDRPVRFAAGGDVQRNSNMQRTSREAAAYDPDFVMWGGDLAYANGLSENLQRWYEFFDAIHTTLITPDGRVIPVIVAIGNHEVEGHYLDNYPGYTQNDAWRARLAPFFYDIFAMPGQPGYKTLDFGDYMSVLLLDTDHTNPVDGEQAEWLEDRLEERQDVPHVFPLYHIPAYPSVRSPDGRSKRVRETWVPLFEEYGVEVAFENHDHAYKRTFPLRGGQPSSDGVVYLGDGAWGVNPRPVGRDHEGGRASYLERAESVRHFILGEINGDERHFIAVDETGEIIDEFPAGSHSVIGEPRFQASAAAPASH